MRQLGRYHLRTALLLLGLAAFFCSAKAGNSEVSVNRSVRLSVSEYSVCLYGHWQGQDIIIEQRDCVLLVNGIRVLPVAYEGWTDAQYPECTEGHRDFVSGRYDMYEILLSNDVAIVVTPDGELYVSEEAKPELLADVDVLAVSGKNLNETTWSGQQLEWFLARWLVSPLDLDKCREAVR